MLRFCRRRPPACMRNVVRTMSFTYPVPKNLHEVAKVQLLETRDPNSIKKLWYEQFCNREHVVTSNMCLEDFKLFRHNCKHSPMFLVPLVKGQGASFNLVLQFASPKNILFTSVDSAKFKGLENSAPYFIMTLFDELSATKDLVLIRGDIVNSKDISKQDAKFILDFVVKCYTDINLYQWVNAFNHKSREFNFDEFKNKIQGIGLFNI